jgi:septal ring-binding cell division protein DamX
MGGDNPEQLLAQIENLSSQVEIDNIFVYLTNVNEKPYISVLYGTFSDRASASKVLSDLPKPLKTYRPQLRTVGGINEEIKQLQ